MTFKGLFQLRSFCDSMRGTHHSRVASVPHWDAVQGTRSYQHRLQHWAGETWQVWPGSVEGEEAHFVDWKRLEKVTWKNELFSDGTSGRVL